MSSEPTTAVRAAIGARPGVTPAPLATAPGVTMYKLMGKIFAILEIRRIQCVILKCDPHLAEILREQYAGVGHRSHLDRRFWICVDLDADVPEAEIVGLVEQAYALVRRALMRKQKAALEGVEL